MRLLVATAATVGLMLFSAATAQAASLYFGAPSASTISVGHTFTIDLLLDTQGNTDLTSVFASVQVDPTQLQFVSGNSPGGILVNTSTFESLQRVSQPFTIVFDPAGLVRAASFSATGTSGTGVASNNQLLATLTFQAIGEGTSTAASLLAPGDDITSGGVSIAGSASFGSSSSIRVIPEPGTALLMGLGLLGLATSGRRE